MNKATFYLFLIFYVIMASGCVIGGLYFFWKGSYLIAIIGLALGIYMMKPNKDT